jgi:hypothetical protein
VPCGSRQYADDEAAAYKLYVADAGCRMGKWSMIGLDGHAVGLERSSGAEYSLTNRHRLVVPMVARGKFCYHSRFITGNAKLQTHISGSERYDHPSMFNV